MSRSCSGVAVSFTGGKDSVLALHLYAGYTHKSIPTSSTPSPKDTAPLAPNGGRISLLVTFIPAPAPDGKTKEFKAHPLDVIKAQATSLGIPHVTCTITAPFLESYRDQIQQLNTQHGIDTLVTGDILDVSQGFMQRAAEGTGVQLATPLWQLPRTDILQAMFDLQIRSIISCINLQKFSEEPGELASSLHAQAGAGTCSSTSQQQQQQQPVVSAPPVTATTEGTAGGSEPAGESVPQTVSHLGSDTANGSSSPCSADISLAPSDPPQGASEDPPGLQQQYGSHNYSSSAAAAEMVCTQGRSVTAMGDCAGGLCLPRRAEFGEGQELDAERDVLGAELNPSLVAGALSLANQMYGVDLCGEGGEYHTLVVDAPLFAKRVVWDAEKRSTARSSGSGATGEAVGSSYTWLALSNVRLC